MSKLPHPKPSDALLARALPLHIWEQAAKQAKRGHVNHFCAGAAIFRDETFVARGCSHISLHSSVHAECNALGNLPRNLTEGADIAIVTIYMPTGSWSFSSRPCGRCARQLHARGIRFAHYAARDEAGIWSVRAESVAELAEIAERDVDDFNGYANRMRIHGVTPVRIVAA